MRLAKAQHNDFVRLKSALFAVCLLARSVYSATLETQWDPVEGAARYDYQVSSTPTFEAADRLVAKGSTRDSKLSESVPPGEYFVRIRALDRDSKPGLWSAPFRVTVKGSDFRIVNPADKAKIEVSGIDAPLGVAWESVTDADDYELVISKGTKVLRSVVSQSTDAAVTGLEKGDYNLTVHARKNGVRIRSSGMRTVSLDFKARQEQRVFSRQGRSLRTPEFERFWLGWTRSLPGRVCDLAVTRMGDSAGVVHRERIEKSLDTVVPGLPKGSYQALVKCFDDTLSSSRQAVMAIEVVDNPSETFSRASGITVRFLSFGVLGGSRTGNNAYIRRLDEAGVVGSKTWPLIEGQVSWQFNQRYRIEGALQSELGEPVLASTLSRLNASGTQVLASSYGPLSGRLRLIVGRSIGEVPVLQFSTIKLGLLYWYLRSYAGDLQSSNGGLQLSNYGLGAVTLGLESRRRIKPSWDVLTNLLIDVPVIREQGRLLAKGSAAPLPNFTLTSFARKRISEEFRLGLGLEFDAHWARVSEPQLGSNTQERIFAFGPRIFLEWDL